MKEGFLVVVTQLVHVSEFLSGGRGGGGGDYLSFGEPSKGCIGFILGGWSVLCRIRSS